MFSQREQQTTDEQLDRVGQALVRACVNDEAVEQTANAPFLYTRLRARIRAEQARRAETGEGWLALLTISRRAVPVLTVVTALVFALMLWLASGASATTSNSFNDEAFFDARETGVEQTVLAGSNNLSRDDVLNIVVEREGQGGR
ncbi:MAG: hypothetical protein DMF64_03740 [Acidobacteria bacterium]|nr:MAG: hypothetical protein DMF64_03740 [Acidobacteriota bacterium]